MTPTDRQRLRAALHAVRDAGRRARFWLRDDDAVEPTPALDTLLCLTSQFDVPAALAAIPARATADLAQRLAADRQATVLVHGWSHANHAPPGEKKQELGPHRTTDVICTELLCAAERIETLFGTQSRPVLVPPWNRIGADLVAELPSLGFRALSVFGKPRSATIPAINATVDIIDWHGTRGGRDPAVLIGEIAAGLDAQVADPKAPAVGLLTHHLVHDAAAWDFLADLFLETTRSETVWLAVDDLLTPPGA